VWGDAHGKFRTSGSGGSATVNGTRWYVANYENGSLFKVSRGVVTVKPLHCPAFKLTAGHSEFLYLENSKKHKKKRKHPLKRKCASE
jgi:ferric-dicitrate binding protein FerR (iron transport regulator)